MSIKYHTAEQISKITIEKWIMERNWNHLKKIPVKGLLNIAWRRGFFSG